MRRLAMAMLALAALGAQGERADREKEIVVGADRLVADDANRTSTFEGNVVVTQGTMRITATKVTVREDKDRHKYYVAQGGPVTFRQKRDKVDEWIEGFAERAEFDDRGLTRQGQAPELREGILLTYVDEGRLNGNKSMYVVRNVPGQHHHLATLEAGQTEVKRDLHEIRADVKEMRAELAGRPSWTVTTIITLLASACAALGSALVALGS